MQNKQTIKIIGLDDLVGKSVFVRAITHYYTGWLVALSDDMMILDEAAWIADTGRFAQALSTGELNEVEPFPGRVYVARAAIVDVCEWSHPLPREVKP